MESIDFDIREACADDIPFIYKTWLESYRYESDLGKAYYSRNSIFYSSYKPVIDRLLVRSHVIVANVKDEPNVILGYLAYDKDTIHYAFTKGAFRHLGVAKGLITHAFEGKEPIFYTHRTIMSDGLIRADHRFVYDGISLLKTGEHNG